MTLFFHFFPPLLPTMYLTTFMLRYCSGITIINTMSFRAKDGEEIVLDLGGSSAKRALENVSYEIYVLRKSIKWMPLITMIPDAAAAR